MIPELPTISRFHDGGRLSEGHWWWPCAGKPTGDYADCGRSPDYPTGDFEERDRSADRLL